MLEKLELLAVQLEVGKQLILDAYLSLNTFILLLNPVPKVVLEVVPQRYFIHYGTLKLKAY